jgi:hypothetical protein
MSARIGLAAVLGWMLCASPALASWSTPALVGGCASASSQAPPLIAFPSSQPAVRSGSGALLWTGPAGCVQAYGGTVSGGATREALAAPLGPRGLPERGRALSSGVGAPVELAAVAGTALGQVIALGDGVLAEGSSPGAFAAPLALGGPATPVALASGYLGDTAIVSTLRRHAKWALAVRVQRHYSATPAAPRLFAVGGGRPRALAVAMDFRSDLLVLWAAGGWIDAREITQAGTLGALERVAPDRGLVELRALISDDGRAIVAWRTQSSLRGGGAQTSIEASISGVDMAFAGAATVESFVDLPGLVPPPGSLDLTRLSSEAVMIAWTGMRAGRYVVRASPVSLRRGVWAPVTISPRGRQATLASLVPGPRAEALALWTTAPRLPDGTLDGRRRAIFAAWGHYGGHGEARFATAEAVAAPGPNGVPSAAFDPQSDTALAAWTAGLQAPRIAYAQRAAGPPPGAAVAVRGTRGRGGGAREARGHGTRDALLPALGLLLLAAAAAWQQRGGHRRAARPRRA